MKSVQCPVMMEVGAKKKKHREGSGLLKRMRENRVMVVDVTLNESRITPSGAQQ
jgi:hypothetical protein